MPKGLQSPKKQADAVSAAAIVAKIATEEIEETTPKKSGWTKSGKACAKARAHKLSAEERGDIVHKAANARWSNE